MSDWLMAILKCPITSEPLCLVDAATLETLQLAQRSGQLFSHKGTKFEQAFDNGLVNQSRTYFYPISNNIPTLLPDEAISLGKSLELL